MQSVGVQASGLLEILRSLAGCGAVLIAIASQLGCDAPSSSDGLPLPDGIVVPRTPEEKLGRVMERMNEALLDAQAARGVGVVSERSCDHRLIPPEGADGKYTAEITIRTKLMLASAPAAETLAKSKQKEEAKSTAWSGEEESDNEAPINNEKEAVKDGVIEEEPTDNGVTSKAIAQSKEQKVEVYQLVYEDDRWKLLTEPKNDTDRLILNFALEN